MIRQPRLHAFLPRFVLLPLVLAGQVQAAHAQSTPLTGQILDPSGAAVSNAQVSLVSSATHTAQHTATSQAGLYSFTSVAAGTYTLVVEANNFARYESAPITASDSGGTTLNIRLQVSSVSQSVEVRDDYKSLKETSTLTKTGTRLEDLPGSVQIISREVLSEQGATMLQQAVTNASGVNYGGQDSKGFYDHFLIRGLDATIYSDSFTDGDQVGGVTHSLNGVQRVEVLEGPGSALFGSGAPGGTISIVHYTPSSTPYYGASLQGGSFGTVFNNDYLTGPTGIHGLNYRVDATFAHSDGFRNLGSHDYEVRPSLQFQSANHVLDFAVDLRHLHETPDSYGILYFNGTPLTNVANTSKYSSPFATARQPFVRPTVADIWRVNDHLTISNRFSYLHRQLDALVNGDSTRTQVSAGTVVGRQLRQQNDSVNVYDYQFEPVSTFKTGSLHHTLLTGFEYLGQKLATNRATADLPNIANAFAPVPPETSLAGINFLCDAKHSCDDDRLSANYYSLYATDQVDVTSRLKLRAGVRGDWLNTSLTPLISVPGRFGTDGKLLLGGVPDTRQDAPVSWNTGILYKVASSVIPYFGVSSSHLANFSSENTQNGVGAPESALQYEAGVKFPLFNDRIALNAAYFHVARNNVAAAVTINGVEAVVFDSQRTRGFEASFDGKATERWHILANVTAQSPVITDNPQGITSIGNRPQGAPANLANVWSTYDFSRKHLDGFEVGAGVNFSGKNYSDITNVNSIPMFVVENATLSYRKDAWGFRVNVDNLSNRRYFIAANAAGAYLGTPVSATGQITWNPTLHNR